MGYPTRWALSWLAVLVAAGISGGAEAATITIMTQNMNEGTDYQALATAQSLPAFVAAVTKTYQDIAATNPTARGGAIAQEIAANQPTFVALQEAPRCARGQRALPRLSLPICWRQ